jgi:hypothetical protein
VFPPDEKFGSTACATDGPTAPQPTVVEKGTLAALPLLTFAAGLTTAAEVLSSPFLAPVLDGTDDARP